MVLDGVVDLRTDAFGFGLQQAQAFSDVLAAVLTACDADRSCAADAPGSALAQYDRLAAQLAEGRRPTTTPCPAAGSTERRVHAGRSPTSAALASVSEPTTRMALQQALNAAARDNLVPLARLSAAMASTDPDTGEFVPDPAFSDALYYAVQCADYDVVPEGSSGRQQLDVWLDAAAAAGVPDLRLGDPVYGDLPVPVLARRRGPPPPGPEPGTDPPYPIAAARRGHRPEHPGAERRAGVRADGGRRGAAGAGSAGRM